MEIRQIPLSELIAHLLTSGTSEKAIMKAFSKSKLSLIEQLQCVKSVARQRRVHPRRIWQPTAAFWRQTDRAFMLKILGEIAGKGVAARYKNEKVEDLAVKMGHWFTRPEENSWLQFNGKAEPLPNDIVDAFKRWVPAILDH